MLRRGLVGNRWRLVPLVASVSLLMGCGTSVAPTGSPNPTLPSPAASVADDLFSLAEHADRATYHASDPIGIQAVLTYTGTDTTLVPSGSGEGLVAFGLRQLDGPLHMEAAVTADCAQHPMAPGIPQAIPFFKSGAYEPTASDAGFWSQYFSDPVLRLPPGRWAIIATATIRGRDCASPEHDLTATVEITVEP